MDTCFAGGYNLLVLQNSQWMQHMCRPLNNANSAVMNLFSSITSCFSTRKASYLYALCITGSLLHTTCNSSLFVACYLRQAKAEKHFSQQHFERPLGWSRYELDSGGDPLFITYPRYVSAHLSFLLYVTFWKWVKIKLNSVSRLWLLIYLSPFSKSKDGFSRERRFIVTEQILF